MKIDGKISAVWIHLLALLVIGGCGGGSSSAPPPPPPPPPADTTAPTVSDVQAPGATVNRVVTLSVTADDNVGVTEVRFFVDGTELGTVSAAPFSIDWDTSGVADGDYVLTAEAVDAAGNTGSSGEVTVTVLNNVQFTVAPSGNEKVSPVESQGTAQADLTINLATGEAQGSLTVSGITATAAHIHDAFAGSNGPVLLPFEQDAGDPGLFSLPAGSVLDAAGVDRLLAGALYVNVHTDLVPAGELRGQILPENFVLVFADLDSRSAVPQARSAASGRAAITLNQDDGTLVVQARVEGLDDASQAHVHEAYAGATGPVLVGLTQDSQDLGRWFVEDGALNAAGLDAFAAGRLYVNVHSPANPGGEIRGQVVPDGIDVLFSELSGEQQVPALDSNAGGLAAITLDSTSSLVTLHVNTEGLDDASAAHLHGAFAGDSGGVEVGLTQDGSNVAHWFAEEQQLDAGQLDALLSGATYVNVHSPANPGGEIRGQVIPEGVLFAFGRLEGSQQVPAVDTSAGGSFAVTVDAAAGTLVAHANTNGVADATAAHLHDAYAGTSGGVAVGLVQDAGDVTRWSAVDSPLSADQLAAFRAGRWYVNVHTPANPGGEIRGQVAPDPVEVLFTTLSDDEQIPEVASAATGSAATTVNRDTGDITVHLRTSGADDATASHVHSAYAGQNGGVTVGLSQDAQDAGHWSVTDAVLDADGLADYLAGRLYLNLHTPANPGGELRGQIAPRDIQVVLSPMSGDQVEPPVATAAAGVVATTTNLATGRFVAFVNTVGVDDATAGSISVGTNGEEILALTQTSSQPEQWSGSSELDADAFAAYRAGGLYADVATASQGGTEIRGQILPPDAAVFDDEAPTITLASPGNTVSGTVTLDADANDDQGVVVVRFLVDGTEIGSDSSAPYSVDWDTTSVSEGQHTLTAEADDAAGNTGISADVVVTVQNATAVTLSEIQEQVFGPQCSGCHSGPTSSDLPSGMNLSTAADSHAALVDVPSLQVSMDRVEPGDPDNSYLIRKLEGAAGIVGSRMPQGGPFLDQATIDMIRDWIADGAPNN